MQLNRFISALSLLIDQSSFDSKFECLALRVRMSRTTSPIARKVTLASAAPTTPTDTLPDLAVGCYVDLQNGNQGVVRYLGTSGFASGIWVGIELSDSLGKNDGSVQGQRYFDCKANFGVFVRESQIKRIARKALTQDIKFKNSPGNRSSSGKTPPMTALKGKSQIDKKVALIDIRKFLEHRPGETANQDSNLHLDHTRHCRLKQVAMI